ncbi:MAG: nucleotidyltransferase domain-containing protein [Myxococcales bacterium]|nr:nucleotidyltransferase domain-containing protein [Myxococcales bacterium]
MKVPFDEVDPFNGRRVRGLLTRSRRRRGDLQITHVDGRPCPQHVRGTPRIPHLRTTDLDGSAGVHVYEKLDGTNVLLFRYHDADGQPLVSYKTRHRPFLSQQPYGDFVALWRQILAEHAHAMPTLLQSRFAFGFELYGSQLPQICSAQVSLAARLLFALDPDTGQLHHPRQDPAWAFPSPEALASFPSDAAPAAVAAEIRTLVEQRHITHGSEGAVAFWQGARGTVVRKCKPAAVRDAQAHYRALYAHGKQLLRQQLPASAVHEGVAAHADTLPPTASAQRALEVVQEHLRLEQTFRSSSAVPRRATGLDAPGSQLLWRVVWGSHMWGMHTPTSDRDRCVVYLASTATLLRGVFAPEQLAPHRRGQHRKEAGGDCHVYELGRLVQLLQRGSITALFGVISPLVEQAHGSAHQELLELLHAHPSVVFHRGLLRHVRDSQGYMANAQTPEHFRKHLRIACRNLQFGITLFEEGRYALRPSAAETEQELHALLARMNDSVRRCSLPEALPAEPLDAYVMRWRHHGWRSSDPTR